MVAMHKPAMLVLLETKMKNHGKIAVDLGYEAHIQSASDGLFGGIVIMWKEDMLSLDNMTITTQVIHVMDKVLPSHNPWLFSAIYASNIFANRSILWIVL